jgi:uncharacterized protein YndB with AHSA1/START domain
MPNIRHELFIEAPSEKIYTAITTSQGLSAWWTSTNAKPERNSVARFAFGQEYFKEMEITELKSQTQVKWTCIAGAEEWIGTTLSFELQPVDRESLLNRHRELEGQLQQQKNGDQGTVLTFHHDNWKDYTPMFAECNYTWAQFLRSLKLFCETGLGRPWPNQHRAES